MVSRSTLAILAVVVGSVLIVSLVSTQASDNDLNRDPVAQHGDRMVEDADGDGEVTIELSDTQSEDPDHVHDSGNDLLCEVGGSTSTGGDNGIRDWVWYNATNETEATITDGNQIGSGNPTDPVTFGEGVWTIALRVQDVCGARDWTNYTLEVTPDMPEVHHTDTSTGDNWTLNGLWRTTDDCPAANDAFESDPPYLAFTEVASDGCSYATGTAPSGNATLAVNVTNRLASEQDSWYRFGVQFDHWWDTGRSELTDGDKMSFQASFDGGNTWVGADANDDGCGGDADDLGRNCWDDDSKELNTWTTHAAVFDVRDEHVTEEQALFRWSFDAVTVDDNDNPGWFIDDISFFGLEENQTQSWMETGQTYNMTINASSNESPLDVVVDEVTEEEVTLDWVTWNETGEKFYRNATFDRSSRRQVDGPGNHTRLWINASDVDRGAVGIGQRTFDLVDTSPSSYTFANGDVEYEYDAYSGVLLGVEDTTTGEILHRVAAGNGPLPGNPLNAKYALAHSTLSSGAGSTTDNTGVELTCTMGVDGTVAGDYQTCWVEYELEDTNNPARWINASVDWPVYSDGVFRLHFNETESASSDSNYRYGYYYCNADQDDTLPVVDGSFDDNCRDVCGPECDPGEDAVEEREEQIGTHRFELGGWIDHCLQAEPDVGCVVQVTATLESSEANYACTGDSSSRGTCREI